MVTTLCGTSQFLIDKELGLIIDRFQKKHDIQNIERYDALLTEIDILVQATHSQTLFSDAKLVIIRELSANRIATENIDRLILDVPDSIEIVLVEAKLDKRLSLYKSLKKSTELKEFSDLEPQKLPFWLADEAKNLDVDIAISDARYLVERVGTNQAILHQELIKLTNYSNHISKNEIDELTVASPQSTIFQLLGAAFLGNSQKALKIYDDQRAQGTEGSQILAMIIWQIHHIAIILWREGRTTQQISSDFKINPFVLGKADLAAKRLSKTEFKLLVKEVYATDLLIKTTKIDTDDALKNLLVKISQQ
ncbi:MAG: DNA polymerase III subunit delta [Patescibacteria group bacterium]